MLSVRGKVAVMSQASDHFHERAKALFEKLSKRANLHGNKFTAMSGPDEAMIELIEHELRETTVPPR